MNSLAGMTVNERLFALGLLAEWDSAVAGRDRQKMTDILRTLHLGEQASKIVETVLTQTQQNVIVSP
jgi:hypothetical protein